MATHARGWTYGGDLERWTETCAECGREFEIPGTREDYVYQLSSRGKGRPRFYCRYNHWRAAQKREGLDKTAPRGENYYWADPGNQRGLNVAEGAARKGSFIFFRSDDPELAEFVARLQQKMMERNENNRTLGAAVGLARDAVAQLRRGRFRPDEALLGRLAERLRVSPGWLMGLEDDDGGGAGAPPEILSESPGAMPGPHQVLGGEAQGADQGLQSGVVPAEQGAGAGERPALAAGEPGEGPGAEPPILPEAQGKP